jgi:hypothetical protein
VVGLGKSEMGRKEGGREGKGKERKGREGIGGWDGWMEGGREAGRGFAYASLEEYSTRSVQSSPVQSRRDGED